MQHPLGQPKNCCCGPKTGLLARKPAGRSDSSVADGRSPGSRVIALGSRLPGNIPVAFGLGSSLTVAGTAADLGFLSRTAFPLSPFRCGKGTVWTGFRLLRAALSTRAYDMA